jgi:hypothetical protein
MGATPSRYPYPNNVDHTTTQWSSTQFESANADADNPINRPIRLSTYDKISLCELEKYVVFLKSEYNALNQRYRALKKIIDESGYIHNSPLELGKIIDGEDNEDDGEDGNIDDG